MKKLFQEGVVVAEGMRKMLVSNEPI